MMSKPEVIKTFVLFLFKSRLVRKLKLVKLKLCCQLDQKKKNMSFHELKYKTRSLICK